MSPTSYHTALPRAKKPLLKTIMILSSYVILYYLAGFVKRFNAKPPKYFKRQKAYLTLKHIKLLKALICCL